MNRLCKIVPFMVLALQALISTRAVQASDDEVIGYAEDGSYSPIRLADNEFHYLLDDEFHWRQRADNGHSYRFQTHASWRPDSPCDLHKL
ncbi:hypothetical protein CEP51_001658 [Fusarium floridanum]|uniref:Uncharacterized protein n=1 Tax=Fusarium floridanum TaxID=1325733 RepID=A0A428SFL7_9HYPO|nr:hypothetical protein CEP51_001658 [Fusarium floridanum]